MRFSVRNMRIMKREARKRRHVAITQS